MRIVLPDGTLGTNICQRTRKLMDAHDDLETLGVGVAVSQTEWANAERALKQYSDEHGLVLQEVEPEWFARFIPGGRLYRVLHGQTEQEAGPFLLKKEGSIVSLYRDVKPFFEVIKASNVILETDQDANEFSRMLFKVMYGETRQLLRTGKIQGGWEFEWGLGWHRGISRLQLDEQGRITDLTTVAE